MSAFSNATAYDLKSAQEEWIMLQNLRKEEEEIISKVETEIIVMKDACQAQRNVSMTIKDDIK